MSFETLPAPGHLQQKLDHNLERLRSFIGHLLTGEGLKPDPHKVNPFTTKGSPIHE